MLDGAPILFLVFFGLVATLVLAGFVFTGYAMVRSFRAAKAAGLDPFASQTQLLAQAANSEMLAPRQSIEQRLAELDDLHRRGVITAAEHGAARSAALSDDR